MSYETQDTVIGVWAEGEGDRPVTVARECPCGCDKRDGPIAEGHAVGYITGSTPDGEGLTIYLPDEHTFHLAQQIFG